MTLAISSPKEDAGGTGKRSSHGAVFLFDPDDRHAVLPPPAGERNQPRLGSVPFSHQRSSWGHDRRQTCTGQPADWRAIPAHLAADVQRQLCYSEQHMLLLVSAEAEVPAALSLRAMETLAAAFQSGGSSNAVWIGKLSALKPLTSLDPVALPHKCFC